MKKRIFVLSLLMLLLSSGAHGIVIKEEARFVGFSTGLTVYVDYMVTDEGSPLSPGGTADFEFVYGDENAYSDSSWYYFYQFENPIDVNIHAFSLNVYPDSVLSAGWISDVDLDEMPFNHTGVAGDHESTSVTVNPDNATFSPGGLLPNLSFDFDTSINLSQHSTVLFLTSLTPPGSKFSTAQNGDSFNGQLPVPIQSQPIIPEPLSVLLLAAGISALLFRTGVFRSIHEFICSQRFKKMRCVFVKVRS